MSIREAAQAALDALQRAEVEMRYAGWMTLQEDNIGRFDAYTSVLAMISNLTAALAEPQGEPVAWIHHISEHGELAATHVNQAKPETYGRGWIHTPLYTRPAPLQDLSDEEATKAYLDATAYLQNAEMSAHKIAPNIARAVIKAAREKK